MTSKSLILALLILVLGSACQPATKATPLRSTVLPPSSTVTDLPELTATPSPIPAPAPRTFNEGFDGSLPFWTFLQIDGGRPFSGPNVDAGYLVFDLTSPNQWVYALYAGQDYQNVRIDAQVEVRAGDGALGAVCRYSEKNGWYEFNIYSDQTYMLLYGQWLAQGVAHYTPIYHGSSEKIQSGANEIGLLCDGTLLTPFINGVQMRKWDEQKFGLAEGEAGISASSFNAIPFTAAYDWVKVSEP